MLYKTRILYVCVCLCAIDSEAVGPIGVKFFVRASAGLCAEYGIPLGHIHRVRGAQSRISDPWRRRKILSILAILTVLTTLKILVIMICK